MNTCNIISDVFHIIGLLEGTLFIRGSSNFKEMKAVKVASSSTLLQQVRHDRFRLRLYLHLFMYINLFTFICGIEIGKQYNELP